MKKCVLLLLVGFSTVALAQQNTRVIMHLQSSDTLVFKSLVNQIANIKMDIPDAEIELVCHGPGIAFLLAKKSLYANKIDKMKLKDVSMVGCEFTMAQKNIKKEDLVPFASTVPHGIVEIIRKQEANWLYVKVGF
jgi:hypothetical protein